MVDSEEVPGFTELYFGLSWPNRKNVHLKITVKRRTIVAYLSPTITAEVKLLPLCYRRCFSVMFLPLPSVVLLLLTCDGSAATLIILTCFDWDVASGFRVEFRFLSLWTWFSISDPAGLLKGPLCLSPPPHPLTQPPSHWHDTPRPPSELTCLRCPDDRCGHRDPAAGGLHNWSHGRFLCPAYRRGQSQVPGSGPNARWGRSEEVQQHAGSLQDHSPGRGDQRPLERWKKGLEHKLPPFILYYTFSCVQDGLSQKSCISPGNSLFSPLFKGSWRTHFVYIACDSKGTKEGSIKRGSRDSVVDVVTYIWEKHLCPMWNHKEM